MVCISSLSFVLLSSSPLYGYTGHFNSQANPQAILIHWETIVRGLVTLPQRRAAHHSNLSSKTIISDPVKIMRLIHLNFHCYLSLWHLNVQVYHVGGLGWVRGCRGDTAVGSGGRWRIPRCCTYLMHNSFYPGWRALK